MFSCYFYRILLVELLSEKSCKTYVFFLFLFIIIIIILLFSFINLFFMIVKFCSYQFVEPYKFLNVAPRE